MSTSFDLQAISPICKGAEGQSPAFRQVRDQLVALIEGGNIPLGARLPSEPDLAKALGVSRMTLGRALNELSELGLVTRRRGAGTFISSPSEGGPAGSSSVRVLLTGPAEFALHDYYFGTLLIGLRSGLSERGITLTLDNYESFDGSLDPSQPLVLLNPRQEQALAIDSKWPNEAPLVILGARWPVQNGICVDSDNVLASLRAIEHFAGLDHRRVLFIGACPGDANTLDRVKGFHAGIAQYQLEEVHPPILVEDTTKLSHEERERISQALRNSQPTAVLAGGATISLHVCRLAESVGREVPHDLSVIAFDDPPFMALSRPSMTTIAQPLERMAATVCDLLAGTTSVPAGHQTVFHPHLTLRKSTAFCAQGSRTS